MLQANIWSAGGFNLICTGAEEGGKPCRWARCALFRLWVTIVLASELLAVARSATEGGSPLSQPPSVSFAPAVNYAVGGMPVSIVAGDFKGDGHVDLALARHQSGGLVILLNNGDGTFHAAETEPFIWIACNQLALADFDGDGKLDLALNDDPGSVRIYLGKGDGRFEPARILPVAGRPVGLAVGDLNTHGKADLVLPNGFGSNSLSILLGGRAGIFQRPIVQPVGFEPRGLVLGDFNDDGKLDLVTTDRSSDMLCLLTGKGDGTFLPA